MDEVNVKECSNIPLSEYLNLKFPKKKEVKIPLDYFVVKVLKFSAFVMFFAWYDRLKEDIFIKYRVCYKIDSSDSEGWFEEGIFYYNEHDEGFETFMRKKIELRIYSINMPEIRAMFSQKKANGVSV